MAKYEILIVDNVEETEQSIGFKTLDKFVMACTKVNGLVKKGSGKVIGRMDVYDQDDGIVLVVSINPRQ